MAQLCGEAQRVGSGAPGDRPGVPSAQESEAALCQERNRALWLELAGQEEELRRATAMLHAYREEREKLQRKVRPPLPREGALGVARPQCCVCVCPRLRLLPFRPGERATKVPLRSRDARRRGRQPSLGSGPGGLSNRLPRTPPKPSASRGDRRAGPRDSHGTAPEVSSSQDRGLGRREGRKGSTVSCGGDEDEEDVSDACPPAPPPAPWRPCGATTSASRGPCRRPRARRKG